MVSSSSDERVGVLERRYRRLLILLPRAYRADRGEEMLTVLMDSAPERRRWPKSGEVLSLVAHGARLRSGLSAEGVPPGAARPLIRAVALLGSLYLGFLSAVSLTTGLRWTWGIYLSDINHSDLDGHHHTLGEVVVVKVAAGVLWPAAYAAVLLGRRRTVRALGVVLIVLAAGQITGGYTALAAVPALITAGAVLVTGRRRITPAAPMRWWLLPVATAAVAVGALAWYTNGTHWQPALTAPLTAVAAGVVTVLAMTAASAASVLKVRVRPELLVAAAVIGGMAALQRALDANHYPESDGGFDSRLGLILIGEAVLLLAALAAIIGQRRTGPVTAAVAVPVPVIDPDPDSEPEPATESGDP